MRRMLALVYTIRLPNLMMVALTMYLLRLLLLPFSVEAPALKPWPFLLLTLSCTLVTLGGYLINDFYDFESDHHNGKREKKMTLSADGLLKFYGFTLTISLGAAIGAAYASQHTPWLWFWPLAVFLLWWYAKQLKGSVLWGNLLVSLFCAAVPLLVWFAAMPQADVFAPIAVKQLVWIYAIFAFLSNMLREVVKDGEDIKGDSSAGQRTLAVQFGLKASMLVARLFYVLLSAVIVWWFLMQSPAFAPAIRFLVLLALVFPLLMIGLQLLKPLSSATNWRKMSGYAKLLMLAGLLLLLLPQ